MCSKKFIQTAPSGIPQYSARRFACRGLTEPTRVSRFTTTSVLETLWSQKHKPTSSQTGDVSIASSEQLKRGLPPPAQWIGVNNAVLRYLHWQKKRIAELEAVYKTLERRTEEKLQRAEQEVRHAQQKVAEIRRGYDRRIMRLRCKLETSAQHEALKSSQIENMKNELDDRKQQYEASIAALQESHEELQCSIRELERRIFKTFKTQETHRSPKFSNDSTSPPASVLKTTAVAEEGLNEDSEFQDVKHRTSDSPQRPHKHDETPRRPRSCVRVQRPHHISHWAEEADFCRSVSKGIQKCYETQKFVEKALHREKDIPAAVSHQDSPGKSMINIESDKKTSQPSTKNKLTRLQNSSGVKALSARRKRMTHGLQTGHFEKNHRDCEIPLHDQNPAHRRSGESLALVEHERSSASIELGALLSASHHSSTNERPWTEFSFQIPDKPLTPKHRNNGNKVSSRHNELRRTLFPKRSHNDNYNLQTRLGSSRQPLLTLRPRIKRPFQNQLDHEILMEGIAAPVSVLKHQRNQLDIARHSPTRRSAVSDYQPLNSREALQQKIDTEKSACSESPSSSTFFETTALLTEALTKPHLDKINAHVFSRSPSRSLSHKMFSPRMDNTRKRLSSSMFQFPSAPPPASSAATRSRSLDLSNVQLPSLETLGCVSLAQERLLYTGIKLRKHPSDQSIPRELDRALRDWSISDFSQSGSPRLPLSEHRSLRSASSREEESHCAA